MKLLFPIPHYPMENHETSPAQHSSSRELITREQFMNYFRSDSFHEEITPEDASEIFLDVLHGASDITPSLMNELFLRFDRQEMMYPESEKTRSVHSAGQGRSDCTAICESDSQGSRIAEVHDGHKAWQANAKLLAAAPELLEACKSCLEDAEAALSGEWDRSDDGFRAQVSLLRRAIGNADGKVS